MAATQHHTGHPPMGGWYWRPTAPATPSPSSPGRATALWSGSVVDILGTAPGIYISGDGALVVTAMQHSDQVYVLKIDYENKTLFAPERTDPRALSGGSSGEREVQGMSGLEQRLEALEARLAAVEAKAEIADLMGRYALWCGADCGGRIVEELWSQADDVSLEYGASGIYEGLWKVKTFYIKEAVPGRLDTVSFSSPSITLSPDGLTAWGSWTAFGTQTDAGIWGARR